MEECGANFECSNLSGHDPICVCNNHWEGDDCDSCPDNWDPEKECAECRNYWSGANCETCNGYGDLCQCPSDEYIPQPGSERCWTCPRYAMAVEGQCTQNYASITWSTATASCPQSFHLPNREEIGALLDNCFHVGSTSVCDSCENSTVCSQMYGNIVEYDAPIGWVSNSCSADQAYYFLLFTGRYLGICSGSDATMAAICVK